MCTYKNKAIKTWRKYSGSFLRCTPLYMSKAPAEGGKGKSGA